MAAPMLTIHMEEPDLARARRGRFSFVRVVAEAVRAAGWEVALAPPADEAPPAGAYALHHMAGPRSERALYFRRSYLYPFWRIEAQPERWRWPVARTRFDPDAVDPEQARRFAQRLRDRHLPGVTVSDDGPVLIALQGRIGTTRSFQVMSPLDMVQAVAATGCRAVVTLHPREHYREAERARLDRLLQAHPNLTMGTGSADILPGCSLVATMNSTVAFEGFLLGKPAVLFGQSDFHHIALNVSRLGVGAALRAARTHRPPYERYLWWFLRLWSIDSGAAGAPGRVIASMRRNGWPI